jgi:glutamine amidotransferase
MIGVIDYNMGNIQSVVNAFEFIGEKTKIVRRIQEVEEVDRIVLPGVGAFGRGMANLNQLGFIETLNKEVIGKRKPFLGICLGMQLICRESFEFGHFLGLGWIDASVRRFKPELGVRVPHVGWNNLIIKRPNRLLNAGCGNDVYFVHSYCADVVNQGVVVATCEYGREFAAIVEKDNIFAVQFHPEKSQRVGLEILKNFAGVIVACLKRA